MDTNISLETMNEDETEDEEMEHENNKLNSSPSNLPNMEDEMAEIHNHLHGHDAHDEKSKENNHLKSFMNDRLIAESESHIPNNDHPKLDSKEINGNDFEEKEEEETDEEDEEEDNVQITIGEIDFKSHTSSGYINLNLQKGGRQFAQNSAGTKNISKSALDLDNVGIYNGMQIYDVNLDSIEDKPWRKPGSDITDYFNYGFTEETWKVYCERQRKIRSMNHNGQFDVNAVINSPLMVTNCLGPNKSTDQREPLIKSLPIDPQSISTQTVNENSKYNSSSSIVTINTQQPQLMMKKSNIVAPAVPTSTTRSKHSIDVIGSQVASTSLALVPPPPPSLSSSGHSLLGPPPALHPTPSSTSSQTHPTSTSDRSDANSISVIGNRTAPSIPFPPIPPPPFGFPTLDPHFPPSIHPPIGMLPPPIGPNGQPLPFGGPDFPPPSGMRTYPPPPGAGILPHPNDQRPFEDFDERRRRPLADYDEFERESRNSRDRYRASERDYEERSGSSRHSSYRERDYERDRDRERKERSRERTDRAQHESSSSSRSRSNRDRENRKEKDKDRDREHRDSHREKDSSKSKSKHESSSTSNSDHKHRSSHAHSSSKSKSSSKRETSTSRSKDSSRKESDNGDK